MLARLRDWLITEYRLLRAHIYWLCHTETRCAWCNPPRILRPALIKAKQHSDGMCPECADAWMTETPKPRNTEAPSSPLPTGN